MNSFIHAKSGNIFVLTEKGRQMSRIRAKYISGSRQYNERYQKHAPSAWLENDWIEEVDWRKYYGNKD